MPFHFDVLSTLHVVFFLTRRYCHRILRGAPHPFPLTQPVLSFVQTSLPMLCGIFGLSAKVGEAEASTCSLKCFLVVGPLSRVEAGIFYGPVRLLWFLPLAFFRYIRGLLVACLSSSRIFRISFPFDPPFGISPFFTPLTPSIVFRKEFIAKIATFCAAHLCPAAVFDFLTSGFFGIAAVPFLFFLWGGFFSAPLHCLSLDWGLYNFLRSQLRPYLDCLMPLWARTPVLFISPSRRHPSLFLEVLFTEDRVSSFPPPPFSFPSFGAWDPPLGSPFIPRDPFFASSLPIHLPSSKIVRSSPYVVLSAFLRPPCPLRPRCRPLHFVPCPRFSGSSFVSLPSPLSTHFPLTSYSPCVLSVVRLISSFFVPPPRFHAHLPFAFLPVAPLFRRYSSLVPFFPLPVCVIP